MQQESDFPWESTTCSKICVLLLILPSSIYIFPSLSPQKFRITSLRTNCLVIEGLPKHWSIHGIASLQVYIQLFG